MYARHIACHTSRRQPSLRISRGKRDWHDCVPMGRARSTGCGLDGEWGSYVGYHMGRDLRRSPYWGRQARSCSIAASAPPFVSSPPYTMCDWHASHDSLTAYRDACQTPCEADMTHLAHCSDAVAHLGWRVKRSLIAVAGAGWKEAAVPADCRPQRRIKRATGRGRCTRQLLTHSSPPRILIWAPYGSPRRRGGAEWDLVAAIIGHSAFAILSLFERRLADSGATYKK